MNMKLWKILAASFAALALFTGCSDDENDETIPTLEISVDTLTFDASGGSSTFTVTSNRDWTITSDEWLSADPASGTASDNPVTVTVTALSNTSTDRTGSIKVATSFDYKTLTVTQAGEGGSAEASVVYMNDFDKEEATQTYGTSGQSWPYLDEFEGWKNEEGTGIASVSYSYSGISVRSNSASNGTYSDYEGSGVNNLLFGKNAYIMVKEITLSSALNYTLSFGTEKYVYGQDDNTFDPEEFHVYISNDTTKWVELTYEFPDGYKDGRWDLASTTFTVPSGTSTLSIYICSDLSSSHRLDDLMLVESSEAGTAIDFSTGTEIDNGSESEDTPSGSGTLDDPYNPAMAAEVASALESGTYTDSNVYIKGKISSIKYEFDVDHGTATFNISEDGTTSSLEFQCYSVYYLENKPWVEGNTQIQVGDEVIIYGKLTNYNGTPETASKQAYIYSLNGNTENEVSGEDTGEIIDATLAEFIAAEESTTQLYRIKGVITKIQSTTYGNIYITDGTDTVYIYGVKADSTAGNQSFSELGAAVGDTITVVGHRGSYNGTIEMTDGYCEELVKGSGSGDTGEILDATLAEFIAAAESTTQLYRINGVITEIKSTTYGNIYITDGTDTVFIYGVKANSTASNTSFSELGAAVGDTITVVGHRGSYNGTIEMTDGYCEELVKGSGSGSGGTAEQFASNIEWTNGDHATDTCHATVNGVSGVQVFKLGTKSNVGTATIKIPQGTTKVSYYAVAWKNMPAKISILYNGTEVYSQDIAANDGASNNSPFTLTVTDSDYYEFDLTSVLGSSGAPADLTATVTTSGSNNRILLFGMKAE
jgi:hypothetical protein